MTSFSNFLFFAVISTITLGCRHTAEEVDLQKEKQALLSMHARDRENHFSGNAKDLAETSLDTFIYVGDGKISYMSKDQQLSDFTNYFRDAKYTEWDNLEEPIVRISQDGTLAWMITRITVKRTQTDSTGNTIRREFVYAGIMTYKKVNGKWMRDANVSTFEN